MYFLYQRITKHVQMTHIISNHFVLNTADVESTIHIFIQSGQTTKIYYRTIARYRETSMCGICLCVWSAIISL